MVVFFLIYFLVRFLLIFRCTFRRCLVCICPFVTLISCSVYFWGWIRGNFSGGPGHMFFSVWGSAMWSVGPVRFIRMLAWSGWRGCTGFSFLGLCWGGYGTIEIVGGCGRHFFSFFSFAFRTLGGRLSVVGLHFLKLVLFGSILVTVVGFVSYKLFILFCFVTAGGGRIPTRRAMSPCWSRRSWLATVNSLLSAYD